MEVHIGEEEGALSVGRGAQVWIWKERERFGFSISFVLIFSRRASSADATRCNAGCSRRALEKLVEGIEEFNK